MPLGEAATPKTRHVPLGEAAAGRPYMACNVNVKTLPLFWTLERSGQKHAGNGVYSSALSIGKRSI